MATSYGDLAARWDAWKASGKGEDVSGFLKHYNKNHGTNWTVNDLQAARAQTGRQPVQPSGSTTAKTGGVSPAQSQSAQSLAAPPESEFNSSGTRRLSEIFYWWFAITGTWPTRDQVESAIAKSGTVDLMISTLQKDPARYRGTPGVLPTWAIDMLREEVGSYAAFLSEPELGPIILKAAALGYDQAKTQAAIEASRYYQNSTAQQRQWNLLTPAEQTRAVAEWEIQVLETLRELYGPDELQRKGYTLGASVIRSWAAELAQGRQSAAVFTYFHRAAAEGISGTPAYEARAADLKKAGKSRTAIEDIRGELEAEWRDWVGPSIKPPDLRVWAESIFNEQKARQEFTDFAKSVSKNAFASSGKPDDIGYSDWVAPAKSTVGRILELGQVSDDDPLVQSYLYGPQQSLADLAVRARQDLRFDRTTRARGEASSLAMSIREAWGF